jgi:hypothetical protein
VVCILHQNGAWSSRVCKILRFDLELAICGTFCRLVEHYFAHAEVCRGGRALGPPEKSRTHVGTEYSPVFVPECSYRARCYGKPVIGLPWLLKPPPSGCC